MRFIEGVIKDIKTGIHFTHTPVSNVSLLLKNESDPFNASKIPIKRISDFNMRIIEAI
jgi:hypothetical protein